MIWHYRVKAPDEKVRDPIQGEFFSTEAIKNPADALVREAIQNALDAALKDSTGQLIDVLRVRLYLATGAHALSGKQADQWFQGTWEHFHAPGNGLREAPLKTETCPYLVFEDFTTTGLEGDITQSEPIDGVANPFFYFFRAEGLSGKGGGDLGRWGVGKHVFPRSSRANAFFGLSVRDDDKKKILMGHTVFKSHRTGGKFYCPDGYFGSKDGYGLVLPVTDVHTIEKFTKDFHIKRTTESGLSVVVPWVDPEITANALIEAAVRGYFFPILTGALSVTVETPETSLVIDDSTLDEAALLLADKEESKDILNLVELAEWASTRKPQDILKLAPCDPERPEWRDDLIPTEQLKPLRAALENGSKLAIRAFLTVREKGKTPQPARFDFFLRQDGFESGRPVFIRDGLIISDVRSPRARGIRSFVVVEAGPLATLLGDSENPAHTEWQSKGENFRGKYTHGPAYLDFVTKVVPHFVQALTAQDEEVNKTLLLDFFSLPADKPENELKQPEQKKKKKGTHSDDDTDDHEPKKKRFRVQKADGGFTVTRGDAGTQPPARLNIRVAYDVRRGNPLRKYNPADFRLNQTPISLDPPPKGLKVVAKQENRLLIDVLDPEFNLTVTGFDEKRDLFVDVKMEEGSDDSQV